MAVLTQEDKFCLAYAEEELEARASTDPLRTWMPHARQKAFIDAVLHSEQWGYENWLVAANRFGKCITPWTPLEMDSATRLPVELIGERGFYVRSWDGVSRCTKRASAVFLKGIAPAFRLHLDTGEVFEAPCTHRVLTPEGWASLGSLLSSQDGPHLMETGEGYWASCDTDNHQYGLRLPQDADSERVMFLPRADVHTPCLSSLHVDVKAPTRERIRACLDAFPLATPDDPALLAALCALWTTHDADTSDPRWSCECRGALQPHAESSLAPEEGQCLLSPSPSDFCHAYYVLPRPILLSGGVMLIGYQKIGLQPIVDFTVEETHCYIAGGAVHHNSDVGAYCGAHLARDGIEPTRPAVGPRTQVWDRATTGWIVGPDYTTLTQVLLPKYLEWPGIEVPPGAPHAPFIPMREVEYWNAAEQNGKLKNGSLIRAKSNEQRQIRFAAAGVDWIHFDEEPLYRNYQEATLRVEAGRRLRIFGTCTLLPPEGKIGGVSWLYTEIIKPWQAGRAGVNVFGGSIYDNPHLDPAEIQRLEAKYPEGSPQRRIRLGGEYLPGIGGARAYGNFFRGYHVRELGDFDPRFPLCWLWDFNVSPFCTTLGQHIADVFRIHKELVLEEGSIPMMVDLFKETVPEWPGELWIYGDATSGARDVQTAKSDYDLIRRELLTYRMAGLRVKVPQANPYVKDRLNAVNQALKDERGFIGLLVDPSCTETIDDFEGVLLDERGGIKKTFDRSDPYFRRTHISDGIGYFVWALRPVRMPLPRHMQQQDSLTAEGPGDPLARFRRSQPVNWTGNPFARSA